MVYFIVNKTARTGKGASCWGEVRTYLKNNNIEFKAFQTKYKGHAAVLARQISSLPDEKITLIVIGGDGTINEVANGIANFEKVELGVIPAGSGNDFAHGIGVNLDLRTNLDRIFDESNVTPIDLGHVSWNGRTNPRIFTISSGVGMDAIVCKKALSSKLKKGLNKLGLGKLTYLLITIQTLLFMRKVDGFATIDGEQRFFNQIIFSAAMNLKAEGGGVPMAPQAKATDGKLTMCTAYRINRFLSFGALVFLVLAKHEKLPCFTVEKYENCNLKLAKPMTLHADGEYCGEVTEVTFSVAPFKLKMRGIK